MYKIFQFNLVEKLTDRYKRMEFFLLKDDFIVSKKMAKWGTIISLAVSAIYFLVLGYEFTAPISEGGTRMSQEIVWTYPWALILIYTAAVVNTIAVFFYMSPVMRVSAYMSCWAFTVFRAFSVYVDDGLTTASLTWLLVSSLYWYVGMQHIIPDNATVKEYLNSSSHLYPLVGEVTENSVKEEKV